jgi:hypothetical protein
MHAAAVRRQIATRRHAATSQVLSVKLLFHYNTIFEK